MSLSIATAVLWWVAMPEARRLKADVAVNGDWCEATAADEEGDGLLPVSGSSKFIFTAVATSSQPRCRC